VKCIKSAIEVIKRKTTCGLTVLFRISFRSNLKISKVAYLTFYIYSKLFLCWATYIAVHGETCIASNEVARCWKSSFEMDSFSLTKKKTITLQAWTANRAGQRKSICAPRYGVKSLLSAALLFCAVHLILSHSVAPAQLMCCKCAELGCAEREARSRFNFVASTVPYDVYGQPN